MARGNPLTDLSGQRSRAHSTVSAPPVLPGSGGVPPETVTADRLGFPSQRKSRSGGGEDTRVRVIVVEGSTEAPGCPDRLDAEFNVITRLRSGDDLAHLHITLALAQPKLLLIKAHLDDIDYRLVELCRAHRVGVLVLARPVYGLLGSMRLYRFGGLPWLRLRGRRSLCGTIAKRALDIGLVMAGAPVLAPLMVLIALIICWDGPPFYFQHRVGKRGHVFRLIKFRTMTVDAERNTGPVLSCEDDSRVTWVGRYLRRYRLDELPQLWNVLRGDMSLVGPRPERPEFVDGFRKLSHIPHYDLRHLIRPGLTGIRQLTGGYTSSVEESLRCDLLYASIQSPGLDLKLLALTFADMLRGFPRG